MATNPSYASTPIMSGGILNNSTSSTAATYTGTNAMNNYCVEIFPGTTNGSRVYSVIVSTNSTTTNNVVWIFAWNGTTVLPICQVNIPENSGNSSTGVLPMIDVLSIVNCPGLPFDNTGKQYIELGSVTSGTPYSLYMAVGAALGSGTIITAVTMGANY
ncbi:MAG: hypothetical protein ACLQQ4_07750 [Bacteroidia bacterium]